MSLAHARLRRGWASVRPEQVRVIVVPIKLIYSRANKSADSALYLHSMMLTDIVGIFDAKKVVKVIAIGHTDDNHNHPHAVLQPSRTSRFSKPSGKARRLDMPVTNIFAQNPDSDMSNSFDIHLDRSGNLDNASSGTLISLTITLSLGHRATPLDAMAVNNELFTFNASSINTVPTRKLAALLDTSFTFPLPPLAGDRPHVHFGGKDFPLHPLDPMFLATTEIPTTNGTGTQNETFCYNTYQHLTLDPNTSLEGFDAVLGDAFLRNICAFRPTHRDRRHHVRTIHRVSMHLPVYSQETHVNMPPHPPGPGRG
ncbi:hypothetical protein PHLGIDRAFT_121790 [Phlebiopsis gigantea 11061_1 CR5-6]|uniref:Uncharacterized protein n=1 Tax=Phlebiopsis gigantea (strain 11061_1 CR5-6) TaxID=745531 RepID=A0A0C3S1L4_PHLG1|nr:hypothetical protein PHLGIDRAFT_121790 [Phlebiopsis gigantea 11061_1 CR5-6]